ncbi:MAG: cupin domain-containing protein [Candidatus Binatia bacterium]
MKHKHVAHISEIPMEAIDAPAGSPFGGARQRVGARIGARKLGYSFFNIPPGKAAFPYHTHTGNEEFVYVLEGEAVLRLGRDEMAVSGGTFIACPPGPDYPHQLVNTGNKALRYMVVSTMEYPDISVYPDSNKIGAYATSARGDKIGFRALFLKDQNVNYYDGEDGSEVERIKASTAQGRPK